MILVLRRDITVEQREGIEAFLSARGALSTQAPGGEMEALALLAMPEGLLGSALLALPGVERLLPMSESFLLASRAAREGTTVVSWKGVEVGATALALMAGPCAVESAGQMDACAAAVRAAGGRILRGGSFKPRTSPYAFQGLGEEGLRLHREAADRHGLLVLSEVLDRADLPLVAERADLLQVGSRNMQNFPLLKVLGKQEKPVVLKRGLSATREEFLLAAEYVLQGGNGKVILCERGVRSFDPVLRNTLDLASVCLLKEMTHLPVIVDPSHATGRRTLVAPMARAAVAAGADGLLVEIHPDPGRALSDGPQALPASELRALAMEMAAIAPIVGRTFEVPR
jgi:3-deoxy-7-phosphoheptulonate synthase